jgi:hypothetical protein
MSNAKIFVKMFSSPVMLASILINTLFVTIWVIAGFVPAIMYWIALMIISISLPKRAKIWITEWHWGHIKKVMAEVGHV